VRDLHALGPPAVLPSFAGSGCCCWQGAPATRTNHKNTKVNQTNCFPLSLFTLFHPKGKQIQKAQVNESSQIHKIQNV